MPDLREDVHSSVEDSDSDSDSDSDADVTASAVPPRVFTPVSRSSSHHSVLCDSPVPMMCSELALMSTFSSDTDPDLTDVQRKLQPLPAPVSPVSASRSLEIFLAYDILLLDSAADQPQLAVPLLPLPGDLQLLADAAHERLPASAHHSPSLEPSSSVVPPPPPQDLSREGPFDPYCAAADTGDIPLIPAGLPGCQYQMTSYDSSEVADVDPAYGLQLDHPRFLEYVGTPESARLLTRAPGHWVQTMDKDICVAAALQLQREAGLMTSNLQVLGQFVTSLNRISSEMMRFAFGVFPSDAVDAILLVPRPHRANGLRRPPRGPIVPGPLPLSACNNCRQCLDCFPELSK